MRNQTKQQARSGWRQWREDEAREELATFARSGMSAAAFARSRGSSPRRLEYWTKRLRQGASGVTFVPVTLPTSSGAAFEIHVGDIVIRVRDVRDVEHVARLVVALAGRRPC